MQSAFTDARAVNVGTGLALRALGAIRCGHDPAVLLRVYAKRTRKADTSAAVVIGALSKGALGA
jgi:hypothetical protein